MSNSTFTKPVSFNGATGVPINGPNKGTTYYGYEGEDGSTKYSKGLDIEALIRADDELKKQGGKNKRSGTHKHKRSGTKKSQRKHKHKHERSGTTSSRINKHQQKSQRRRR